MKAFLSFVVILAVMSFSQYGFAAANDIYITQRNPSGNVNVQRTVSPEAESIFAFDADLRPTRWTLGSGLSVTDGVISATGGGGGSGGSYVFTSSDFNESGSTVSIDYTNGQKATSLIPGFLSAADWITFNAKAGTDSPSFTGTPTAPTAAVDTNTTQIATTAFVIGQSYLKTTTAASTYQPLDSDLTTYANITPSANVQSLLGAADYAAMRALLSLGGAALLNVGTTAGTVAAGDDSRITGAVQTSTLNGYFADPSTNGSFDAVKWRVGLGLTIESVGGLLEALEAKLDESNPDIPTFTYGMSTPNVSPITIANGETLTITNGTQVYKPTTTGAAWSIAITPGIPDNTIVHIRGTTTYDAGDQTVTLPNAAPRIEQDTNLSATVDEISIPASSSGGYEIWLTIVDDAIESFHALGDTFTATTDATSVTFSPAGNVSAGNVQAAIEELDSEKVPAASLHAVATSGDYDDLSNKPTIPAAFNAFTTLTFADPLVWAMDASKIRQQAKVTLTGDATLSITGAANGMFGVLKITQDGTGGRKLTLPTGSRLFGSISEAADDITRLSWEYDGTHYLFVANATPTGTGTVGGDVTAPELSSFTVGTDGTTATAVLTEAVTIGAGGAGGWAITPSGGAATVTYQSGSGTDTLSFTVSRTIYDSETFTVAYTQPGNGWKDLSENELDTFSGTAGTNNSTQQKPSYLLDQIATSSAGAWSVARRLSSTYSGPLVKLRKVTAGTESDFGSGDDELDVSEIETWASGEDVAVVTVYDQSGNSRDLTQATPGSQPLLAVSGTVNLGSNNKPALVLDGTDDHLAVTRTAGLPITYFAVVSSNTTGNNDILVDGGTNARISLRNVVSTGNRYRINSGAHLNAGSTYANGDWDLVTAYFETGASDSIQINADAATVGTAGDNAVTAYRIGHNTTAANAEISELVVYEAGLNSTDQDTLRADINAFYALW